MPGPRSAASYGAFFSYSHAARFVLASDENTVRIYDVAAKAVHVELSGHTGWVKDAAFSADGTRVVTASEDGTARVWEVAGGRLVAELSGHKYGAKKASFSPDGRWVVTAGGDQKARVWNASTGAQVAELSEHPSEVMTALFAGKGRMVVTASEDATVLLHPWEAFAPIDSLRELVPTRVKRALTVEERQVYLHESVED